MASGVAAAAAAVSARISRRTSARSSSRIVASCCAVAMAFVASSGKNWFVGAGEGLRLGLRRTASVSACRLAARERVFGGSLVELELSRERWEEFGSSSS